MAHGSVRPSESTPTSCALPPRGPHVHQRAPLLLGCHRSQQKCIEEQLVREQEGCSSVAPSGGGAGGRIVVQVGARSGADHQQLGCRGEHQVLVGEGPQVLSGGIV